MQARVSVRRAAGSANRTSAWPAGGRAESPITSRCESTRATRAGMLSLARGDEIVDDCGQFGPIHRGQIMVAAVPRQHDVRVDLGRPGREQVDHVSAENRCVNGAHKRMFRSGVGGGMQPSADRGQLSMPAAIVAHHLHRKLWQRLSRRGHHEDRLGSAVRRRRPRARPSSSARGNREPASGPWRGPPRAMRPRPTPRRQAKPA